MRPLGEPGREQWGSRLGFVLAAVGSAVGLGNMWRFPYLTAESGGALFLLLYLGFMAVVGLPLLLAELALGRGARKGPIAALAHFGGHAWAPVGILFVATGALVFAFYTVISGWSLRYVAEGVAYGFAGGAADHFNDVATGWDAAAWHLGFVGLTVAVVLGGVRRGIERASFVMVPLLVAVLVGLAIYSATLDGSGAGYGYYLTPDLRAALSWRVVSDAASQAFFSLGVGTGLMLTYGSYLGRGHHLPNAALIIGFADFGVGLLAGLALFPLLFALGMSSYVSDNAVGALFVGLPQLFAEMEGAGTVVGIAFFIVLTLAALTSTIALLEMLVAVARDAAGWTRRRAALVAGSGVAVIGLLPALDVRVLGWMDRLAGNLLTLTCGLALAVFVGWRLREPMVLVEDGAHGVRWFFLWRWLLRIPVPLVLAIVLYERVVRIFF